MRIKILLYIFFCLLLSSCNGLFYPKVDFIVYPKGDIPPFSPKKRLDLGAKHEQELSVLFQKAGNSLSNTVKINVFVQKPYGKLNIKKILYKTELQEGLLFKSLMYTLPQNIRTYDEKSNINSYVTKNGNYYWCRLNVIDGLFRKAPSVDLYKHLSEYKIGSKFDIELIFHYSFDNEEIKILNLTYTVEVRKGEYISPFMGW